MQQSTPPLVLHEISDETMREALSRTRGYTVVILKRGPAYDPPHYDGIIWEHPPVSRAIACRPPTLV